MLVDCLDRLVLEMGGGELGHYLTDMGVPLLASDAYFHCFCH